MSNAPAACKCGKEYEAVPNLTNCSCGGILDIIYDYDYIKTHLTKETLKNPPEATMWRYRELLPVGRNHARHARCASAGAPLYEEPTAWPSCSALQEALGQG